jgi:predicted  nucleic acid-binding Zn-ribbon protein
MKNSILEINQSKKVAGRTNVKWVVLELHDSHEQFNKNGITWLEEFVQANIDSIKGMPICAEFLDDWQKDEPFGHGFSETKDGKPLFEYSVVVGSTENGYIDTVEVNGEQKKVLIAEGYLYNQRYPKFVQWLKSEMYDDKQPDTSVEICAKDGYDYIVYNDGWKEKGRVPKIFDFSGSAILGIEPADDSAVLLELNAKIKKEDKKMADNKETILELNNKLDQKSTEINELKNSIKDKDSELEKVQGELNSKQEELGALVDKNKEVEKELNEVKTSKEDLEKELNSLKEFKKEVEDEKLKVELNQKLSSYTEDEQKLVEDKVNEFNEAPSQEKMDAIVNEINSEIAKAILAERQKQVKSEKNNKNDDIFSDVVEVNNNEVDDDDLF